MIIVTGAAGLIGSAIIWALNDRGEDHILAVDSLGTDDRWMNLRSLRFCDYIEKEDFLSQIKKGLVPAGTKAIIHMGACSDTMEKDASFLVQNNFQYTKEIASCALWHGIRFIYASSAATYGDGSQGYTDDENKLHMLRPLNMYGYSKHLFDLWAKNEGVLDRITGLKYFNVFGPNEYHKGEMRSMVLKAFEQISATGLVKLFKSYRPEFAHGEQRRDFLYVKDAARMTLFFLDNNATGIFNIGSGQASTWKELANAVFKAMRKKPRIEYIDMPQYLKTRYQYYTCAPVEKLKSAGWQGKITSLEDAVKDYVQNYLTRHNHLTPSTAPASTNV